MEKDHSSFLTLIIFKNILNLSKYHLPFGFVKSILFRKIAPIIEISIIDASHLSGSRSYSIEGEK